MRGNDGPRRSGAPGKASRAPREVPPSRASTRADASRPWFPRRNRGPSLPFTSGRFHALLNSLFKVLFNFPSRYLFAIGLAAVFSLGWRLPPALSCTLKQLDSWESPSHASAYPERASHPLWEKTAFQRTWSGALERGADLPEHHIPCRRVDGGFGAGLFPVRSPLLGESSLVSFPPLNDMLKFSGYSRLIRGPTGKKKRRHEARTDRSLPTSVAGPTRRVSPLPGAKKHSAGREGISASRPRRRPERRARHAARSPRASACDRIRPSPLGFVPILGPRVLRGACACETHTHTRATRSPMPGRKTSETGKMRSDPRTDVASTSLPRPQYAFKLWRFLGALQFAVFHGVGSVLPRSASRVIHRPESCAVSMDHPSLLHVDKTVHEFFSFKKPLSFGQRPNGPHRALISRAAAPPPAGEEALLPWEGKPQGA